MVEGFAKVTELFRKHNYSDCFEAMKEAEKLTNLTKDQKKILSSIKTSIYIRTRKFDEAYKIYSEGIEKFTKTKNWELVFENYINKIKTLAGEGKQNKALELIAKVEKLLENKDKLTPEVIEKKGELLYLKGRITSWTVNKGEGKNFLQQTIDFSEKNKLLMTKNNAKHQLGLIYCMEGDYETGFEILEEALAYFEGSVYEFETAGLLHNLGVSYAEIGEYKKSRECFRKKAQIVDPTPHDIAAIGDSYWREGEIDKGIEEMKRGMEQIRSTFKKGEKHGVYQFIQANLYLRIGEQDKALEIYNNLLSHATGEPGYLSGFCLMGVALVYYHKGELIKAIKHAQQALQAAKRAHTKYGIGYGNYILGKIYYEKGEKEPALHHLQKSLDMRLAMGNKNDIALTLRELISIMLDDEKYDEAEDYLALFEQIAPRTDSRVVKHNYLLSKALNLKSKGRPKEWIKAIDIFEEIVSERISDYNTLLVALINLCELLLNEFSISGNQEVLDDLQTHTSRLLDIAQKQNSYTLRVEAYHIRIITLWLLAQHSKVDINVQNARKLLQEARELAESHGLARLASKIHTQNEKMLEKLESWDEFIRKYYEVIKTS